MQLLEAVLCRNPLLASDGRIRPGTLQHCTALHGTVLYSLILSNTAVMYSPVLSSTAARYSPESLTLQCARPGLGLARPGHDTGQGQGKHSRGPARPSHGWAEA